MARKNESPGSQVYKADLKVGDLLTITTENSIYFIRFLGENLYEVKGGWFDRNNQSPKKLTITGCKLVGNAVKADIVAAVGFRIEFGNNLLTTPIREISVSPGSREKQTKS